MGQKHIVYEAFCADGSSIPPVIFLPEPITEDVGPQGQYYSAPYHKAYLVHMPNLGNPSEASTLEWLKKLTHFDRDYFDDNPHVVLDSLKGHFGQRMEEKWQDAYVTTHRIPAGAGKWLNPCDQAINRELRRTFTRLQQQDRSQKLDNIIEAYYALKESTIKNSFNRCGLFEGDPSSVITKAVSQGYVASEKRRDSMARYHAAFLDWANGNTRAATDALPRSKHVTDLSCSLDGVHWRVLGTSKRRVKLT